MDHSKDLISSPSIAYPDATQVTSDSSNDSASTDRHSSLSTGRSFGRRNSSYSSRHNTTCHVSSVGKIPVRRISSQDFSSVASFPILQTATDGTKTFITPGALNIHKTSSRALKISHLDEREFIHELIIDICNDLDLQTIYFKILRNVCILLDADRASLFLVQNNSETNQRFLVSQLFDVTANSNFDELCAKQSEKQIVVPFGVGIAGAVADSGNYLNIEDAYNDKRFSRLVDRKTGYRTKSIICMPIKNADGDVVAVAQVVNKVSTESPSPGASCSSTKIGVPFTERDVCVFKSYVDFCGIGLHNAQMFRQSQAETKRIQQLLELARLIFVEQTDVNRVINSMLLHTLSLLECQRCHLLLLHESSTLPNSESLSSVSLFSIALPLSLSLCLLKPEDLFDRVYELTHADRDQEALCSNVHNVSSRRFPINFDLCAYVSRTGETVNIGDADNCDKFGPFNNLTFIHMVPNVKNHETLVNNAAVDDNVDWRIRSLLCMPIKTSEGRVLGVCVFYNKSQSGFWHMLRQAVACESTNSSFGVVADTQENTTILMPRMTESCDSAVSKSWSGRFSFADESMFEAFAIFSGLAIANGQMYEKIVRAQAKQRIALDVLSYHATAPQEQADELAKSLIPSARYFSLKSFAFTDF
ncbi:hypothetical protein Ciccas_004580, partial [Cichlidogyrus casuarinus]